MGLNYFSLIKTKTECAVPVRMHRREGYSLAASMMASANDGCG